MRSSRIIAGAVLAGTALGLPSAAVAQDYVNTTDPPEVRGNTQERPRTQVLGTTTSRDPLAVTGGDVVGLLAIGLGAVGVGTVLVRRGRTRSTASA